MLEPKQKRFCEEYLIDMNATAAAKRAGYSPKNADNTGYKILALPQAQEFIQQAQQQRIAEIGNSARIMTKKLVEITELGMGEFLDENGDLKNPNDLPEHLRQAVHIQTKRIKVDDKVTTVTTYNLCNKIQMMEKISKRLDRIPDKLVDTNVGNTIITAEIEDGVREEI